MCITTGPFDCDAAKILPGEYYYTGKDMLIVTVLGSCVSACIRDRVPAWAA
jgi:chemotaxis protein CheD